MTMLTDNQERNTQDPPAAENAGDLGSHIQPSLMTGLPLEFLQSQKALPIQLSDGEIAIAMADPDNLEAYDAICLIMQRPLRKVVYPAAQIEHAISRCYYHSDEQTPGRDPNGKSDYQGPVTAAGAEDLLNITGKSPLIKLVNNILFRAAGNRASDIHIEPFNNNTRVRFRVDGVLHDIMQLPLSNLAPLIARVKVMSNLNIAERRLPQDGQAQIKIGDTVLDVRVSIIPTIREERVTIRIMEKNAQALVLDQVGLEPAALSVFRRLISRPHGIILITGPTGSGKTTTLYATLNELNNEHRNILTVEDPVEYQLPGIGQMQVKPKINLTFANCLRHILRQDPDMIMIGEIRDTETARIAIQASLTGHLVLSTLHTNDAASAVTRLIDMGIEPYLISSSVIGVMAQRLVRVICPHCKTQAGPLEEPGTTVHYHGSGCENCINTGYRGRTGIFELMPVTAAISGLVIKQAGDSAIKDAAVRESMRTLRQDGMVKAAAGITTLEEVYRVTQDNDVEASCP